MDRPPTPPWYTFSASASPSPPFSLVNTIASKRHHAPTFRTLAFFPWTLDSLHSLWYARLTAQEDFHEWDFIVSEFSDAVAVASQDSLFIFSLQKQRNPICVKLPPDPDLKLLPADSMSIAWAMLEKRPFEPMLLFSRGSLLYIYSIMRNGIVGYLRGHGGTITSIAVHPVTPNIFCTTSRDYSTRIYDLKYSPLDLSQNPHWPPGTRPSLAGAAHGLHMNESEGSGIGRCIGVLVGGRSGGHQAAVLGAAFHPSLSIVATCGLDRAVKIWWFRSESSDKLQRQDKPIFSTSMIHKGRILSVRWLQDDHLMTHSAPALMRLHPDKPDNKKTYLEPGELVVWRWLGLDRFFPPNHNDQMIRGGASDYQESSSFTIVSVVSFPPAATPFTAAKVHVYQSPIHDPIVLYTCPDTRSFCFFNFIHLPPQRPSPFPLEQSAGREGSGDPLRSRSGSLARAAERMHLDDISENDDAEHSGGGGLLTTVMDGPPPAAGWKITIPGHEYIKLENCAMGMDGRVIVGVGTAGTIWVWSLSHK